MDPSLSSSQSICLRLFSLFLIFAILAPALVLTDVQRVSANKAPTKPRDERRSLPIIPSAPPQPYVVHSRSEGSFSTLLASAFADSVSSIFEPVKPEKKANDKNSSKEALQSPDSASNAEGKNEALEGPEGPQNDLENFDQGPAEPPAPPSPTASVDFDFDGDGNADLSRARVATNSTSSVNEFRVNKSGTSGIVEYSLGDGTGKIAPGDYDGDGKTDAAVFKAGTFTYLTAPNPGPTPSATPQTISLGTTGDIPVSADYDGDGKTDAAVFRPSTGVWYIKESSTTNTVNTTWGQSGDLPVVGDYDGDGESDFAVWRPSNNVWYLSRTSAGSYTTTWGVNGTDVAVPADFDGDGQTDIAVFRRTTGVWYVRTSTSGFASWTTQSWGNYGDQPVPADYDGDGTDDYAIWRPKTGWWWIVYSDDSSIHTFELGVQGEQAVPSAYLQQISGSVPLNELAEERLKPKNETGGTSLYSQNFSWGTNLLSLPGRAGHDLSFGIGYNSLVWTKSGSEIYFDLDVGNPSPGFQLGFPTIEPVYFNTTKSKFAYMMVTSSGRRIEFRETNVSNVFETADSSYTQLQTPNGTDPNDPEEITSLTVRTTDGTQMKYEWKGGAYRCTEIVDRNGNYISVTYNYYDQIDTITDTLGRVVTVSYSDGYPSSITQTWKGSNGTGSNTPHPWASFTYMNMDGASGRPSFDTAFSSLTPIGPPEGTELKVLQKITYSNGSSTKFDYNTYAQVYKVSNIGGDSPSHVLNSTEINISSPSSPTDCPKFTETETIVENFNNGDPVTVTNTAPTTETSFGLTGSISLTGWMVKVGVDDHPNDLYTRIHYGPSGWAEGLTVATEDCIGEVTDSTCSTRKRWTWSQFTQDDDGLAYELNPRVVESWVGDGSNTKKTTVSYTDYGLPEYVRVYDSDYTTLLKESHTTYDLDSAYTSRRIIGLPAIVEIKGRDLSGLTPVSKMTYHYDQENFSQEANQNISSVIQHDNTNYSSSFITGRGNLSYVKRWDVTHLTDPDYAVTSKIRYDIAGSVVAQIDPLDRKTSINYTDSWNTTPPPGPTPTPTPTPSPTPGPTYTYAYPTTITDAGGNSSVVKYRYDIGANVWAKSPDLSGSIAGKESTRQYDDDTGRLLLQTNVNNGAYTRYVYENNGIQVKSYSTLIDGGTAGADSGDEVFSESWFDGAGRVRRSRTEHPDSAGGWSATQTEYDILGRVFRQSVPTEVSVSGNTWTPAGDDSSRGWVWNSQEYDWKGRVTRIIPSDSTGSDGKDQLMTYEGCGCAGGQVTTIQGAIADAIDVGGTLRTTKRRTQKIHEDILGRVFKAEQWDLDGGSIYSTVKTTFNGRDQALYVDQFAGSDTSYTATQQTSMTYDGHGRLVSQHLPQQDTSTATEFEYYADDQIHTKTDARGAVTTFTYADDRGLLTKVESELPGSSNTSRKNFAQMENGATVTASSQHSSGVFSAWGAINGDRTGSVWGTNGHGGWNDNTLGNFPDSLEVTFNKTRTIDEVDVITLQDTYSPASEPTLSTTFTEDGLTDYYVQYWDGSSWSNISGASVSSNDKVWKKFTFSPIATTKIKLVVTGALNSYSRVVEFEAWGDDAAPPINTETDFTYDPVGNRATMTDDNGSTAYEYNSLSQMTAETRSFNDTLANAPETGNGFKLQYSYTLSGGLKSITDPYGDAINYDHDKAGRLTEVSGSSYGGLTDYAHDAGYRAWGGLKALSYGNGVGMSSTFNDRLQPDHFELSKSTTEIMKKNYEYNGDGQLKYTEDELNGIFDRLNIFDHAGRIKQAKTGLEARGGSVTTNQNTDLPYRQSYAFNPFNNMTARNNLHWGTETWYGQSNNLSYTYENNRVTNSGWQYDADGRVLQSTIPDDFAQSAYDANGRISTYRANDLYSSSYNTIKRYYDGDGRESKREKINYAENYAATELPFGTWTEEEPIYYIRSTVLGGAVVSETYGDGKKKKTFVMAAGAKIATQSEYTYSSTTAESVSFEHYDASGMSYRSTNSSGDEITGDGQFSGSPGEMDPMGGNMGTYTPYVAEPEPPPPPTEDFPYIPIDGDSSMYVNGQKVTCSLDGLSIGCGMAFGMLGHSADIDFEHTTYGILGQLGILAVFNPNSGRTAPNVPTDPDPNVITISTQQDGGTWSYYFNSISWGYLTNRTTQGPVTTDQLKKDLKEFLEANPNCPKMLKDLGLTNFDEFLDKAVESGIAATSGSSVLNKTLGDLGISERAAFSYRQGEILRNYSSAFAFSNVDKGEVYYFDSYFNNPSAVDRGRTVFHEALHLFTRGSHLAILNAIGLKYSPIEIKVPGKLVFDPRTGKATIGPDEVIGYLSEEETSNIIFNNWLSNNCSPSYLRK